MRLLQHAQSVVLEAAVQALNQAVALGVVGGGGDVLRADGGAEGVLDGAVELRASVWDSFLLKNPRGLFALFSTCSFTPPI